LIATEPVVSHRPILRALIGIGKSCIVQIPRLVSFVEQSIV
jgi:hypothetical protein